MKLGSGFLILLALLGAAASFVSCTSNSTPPAAPAPVTVYYVPNTSTPTVSATPTMTSTPPVHAYITKWGTAGSGNGNLDHPNWVRLNDAGTTVYVDDSYNSRIEYFNNSGSYLGQFGGGGNDFILNSAATTFYFSATEINLTNGSGAAITSWGTFGSGDGEFNNPWGLAQDAYANIYVADSGNNRIEVFGPSGNFVLKWGFKGGGAGQFDSPTALAIAGDGNLYVADTNNYRIEIFSPVGAFLSQFSINGGSFNGGIAISPVNGDVFVPTSDDYVYEYNPAGVQVTFFGGPGSGNGQFSSPAGIAVDASGNIYVSDYLLDNVQKFAP